jgi:hypothetical protein
MTEIPRKYAKQYAAANALLEQPGMFEAFGAIRNDPRTAVKAAKNPRSFLAGFDVTVPQTLDIRIVGMPSLKPGPDWVPFTLRLTQCRVFVVRNDDGTYKTEEVCFGIEIIPNMFPRGPVGGPT